MKTDIYYEDIDKAWKIWVPSSPKGHYAELIIVSKLLGSKLWQMSKPKQRKRKEVRGS